MHPLAIEIKLRVLFLYLVSWVVLFARTMFVLGLRNTGVKLIREVIMNVSMVCNCDVGRTSVFRLGVYEGWDKMGQTYRDRVAG